MNTTASTRRQTPVIRLRARCDNIGFIIFEQVIYDLFFIFSAGIPHSSGVILIVKIQNFPPFGLRPSVPQSRFGLPTFSGLPFRSTLRIRRDTDKTTHPLIEYTEPPLRALLRYHSKRRSSHTLIPRFVFSTRHNPHKFGSALAYRKRSISVRMRAKIASGESIPPRASLQSIIRRRSSAAAAAR